MPALQPHIIEPVREQCCALVPERKTSHLNEAIAAAFVTPLARSSAVATEASRRTFLLIIRTCPCNVTHTTYAARYKKHIP
jgi:hypothetical protein